MYTVLEISLSSMLGWMMHMVWMDEWMDGVGMENTFPSYFCPLANHGR
jgi:hypothetical protein